jgi:membrane dipeptidase
MLGNRILPLALLTACAASPAAPPPQTLAPAVKHALPEAAARTKAIHESAIVVDTHNDITSKILDGGFDLGKPDGKTHTDLARMKAGGITAEFFSIYVDPDFTKPGAPDGGPARRALDMIDVTYQQIERHPDALVLATSESDIRRAKRDGKIAVLMGIEGGHAIENSLFALREFYRLGVRYMTLTHTNTNDWADSAGGFGRQPEARHHGLSPFGEEVVREMQRIGMLVDVSHVSDDTVASVLRVAKAPIIASHSSSRALANVPRNLTDDQLRAIGQNGGVVMVNFFVGFLDPKQIAHDEAFFKNHGAEIKDIREKYKDDHEKMHEELGRLRKLDPAPPTPLPLLIDHIDHVAKVAGIDHVGLGSDFDGIPELPQGLGGVDGLPKITLELVKRGYTDEQVKKVLGENFLRVFAAAEEYARSTKTTLSGDGSSKKL